ncbi:MAG: hypothetical protein GC162_20875 [Planctomycetes bacterium]|nr:hypothetical protein [Planctomycetota bacterium]
MFEQLWTIARNTFTESIRQPIFLVVLGAGLFLLILNPALSAYTLDDDNKLLIDLGLSTMLFGGLALAAFTSTGVLAREIENKTALTVISKPISRPVFVIGKYFGVATAVSMAIWIWSIVFLLSVRHKVMSTASDHFDMPVLIFGIAAGLIALFLSVWGNYFYAWVFTSRFAGLLAGALTVAYLLVLLISPRWQVQALTTEFTKDGSQLGQIVIAILFVLEALAVVCAVAIACSTRLGQVMTLLICVAVTFLGLVSDYFFGRFVEAQPLAWIGYALAPNTQFFWLADALTQNHPVSAEYVGLVSGYCMLYITAVLSLAAALFQTRETG